MIPKALIQDQNPKKNQAGSSFQLHLIFNVGVVCVSSIFCIVVQNDSKIHVGQVLLRQYLALHSLYSCTHMYGSYMY